MSTFNITSSKLNKTYVYENENLVVNGSFVLSDPAGELQSVQGSCYRPAEVGSPSDFVGSFNGTLRNGEIMYTMSEMSRRDCMLVWDAIDEIEANIKAGE